MAVKLTKEEIKSGLYKPHAIYMICNVCRTIHKFLVSSTEYNYLCKNCLSAGTFDVVEVIDESGV